jgi:hypothetical protein
MRSTTFISSPDDRVRNARFLPPRRLAEAAFLFLAIVQVSSAPAVALDKRALIPPPPAIALPLSKVEPARDVPAAQWRSPYCLRWNVGCSECRRASLKSAPSCAPKEGAKENACQASFSICSDYDAAALAKVCANLKVCRPLALPSGNRNAGRFPEGASGFSSDINWDFDNGKWTAGSTDYEPTKVGWVAEEETGDVRTAAFLHRDIARMREAAAAALTRRAIRRPMNRRRSRLAPQEVVIVVAAGVRGQRLRVQGDNYRRARFIDRRGVEADGRGLRSGGNRRGADQGAGETGCA